MKLNIHHRIYRLMWKVWRKKRVEIGGKEIIYAQLPWRLLLGGLRAKSCLVDAMVMTDWPSRALMIFVSDKECARKILRYTLYHEYMEGQFYLRAWLDKADKDQARRKFKDAWYLLRGDEPSVDIFFRRFMRANGLHGCGGRGHLFALTMELALAKREMSAVDFLKFLAKAMEHRL